MIRTAQQNPPFELSHLKHPLRDVMHTDATPIISVQDYKKSLKAIIQANSSQKIKGAMFVPLDIVRSKHEQLCWTAFILVQ